MMVKMRTMDRLGSDVIPGPTTKWHLSDLHVFVYHL